MNRHHSAYAWLRLFFLAGLLGFFYIAHAAAGGGIAVSSNGRTFVDQSGAPFFWMGDTAWQLMTNWSPSDVQIYLDNRKNQGFTVVHALLAYDWNNTGCVSPNRNLDGQFPWIDGNPAAPNEVYFQNVDYIVGQAAQRGMVLALFPVDAAGCIVVPPYVVNSGNSYVYGQWLGSRYKNSSNIVWILGGDSAPTGYEDVFNQLAAGLQAGDGGTHLISYHAGGSNDNAYWPTSSSNFWQSPGWLSFNMIQSGGDLANLYSVLQSDYDLSPVKPAGIGEGAYEATSYTRHATTPLEVRQQGYWSYLGGGYHTYGHNNIMTWSSDWASHLNAPGAQQLSLLRGLLLSRQWWRFGPDQSVFASAPRTGANQDAAARSQDGDSVVAYLSGPTTFSINMARITASSNVRAAWFDPQTGSQTFIGIFANAGVRSFTTPAWMADALLLLDAGLGSASPSILISASPAAIPLGQSSTLTWSSTSADGCIATGDWSGLRSVSGSEVVTPSSTGAKTYTLSCSGPGGTNSSSAMVNVCRRHCR